MSVLVWKKWILNLLNEGSEVNSILDDDAAEKKCYLLLRLSTGECFVLSIVVDDDDDVVVVLFIYRQ